MSVAPRKRTCIRWVQFRQDSQVEEGIEDSLEDATAQEELDGLGQYWRDRFTFFRRKGYRLQPPNLIQPRTSTSTNSGETPILSVSR